MANGNVPFGRAIRDAEFLLDPSSTHINQGSWGCLPRQVFEAQTKLRQHIEFQPDDYFRRHAKDMWFSSLEKVCRFINVKPENAAFIDNATGGINAALKSLPLKAGDQILLYSWTYNAIAYTARRTAEMTGAEVITMELKYPVKSKEEVIDKYRMMFKNHPKIKVAILDYISSATATLFPVAAIVDLCKEYDVISIVDGAHTPGQIHLDIEGMKPDFFIGNLHKWAFCPRSSAVLWVNPKHHGIINPLVTSHCYKLSPWQLEFQQQGTRDFTAYLTSPDGIKFYEGLGGRESITKYVTPLLDEAVQLLVKKWGTKQFEIPRDMEAPFMRLIRVPDSGYHIPTGMEEVFDDQWELLNDLYERFNIHTVPITLQDELWIRISGAAYNSLDEYEKLGDAVLMLVKEKPPQF